WLEQGSSRSPSQSLACRDRAFGKPPRLPCNSMNWVLAKSRVRRSVPPAGSCDGGPNDSAFLPPPPVGHRREFRHSTHPARLRSAVSFGEPRNRGFVGVSSAIRSCRLAV